MITTIMGALAVMETISFFQQLQLLTITSTLPTIASAMIYLAAYGGTK